MNLTGSINKYIDTILNTHIMNSIKKPETITVDPSVFRGPETKEDHAEIFFRNFLKGTKPPEIRPTFIAGWEACLKHFGIIAPGDLPNHIQMYTVGIDSMPEHEKEVIMHTSAFDGKLGSQILAPFIFYATLKGKNVKIVADINDVPNK